MSGSTPMYGRLIQLPTIRNPDNDLLRDTLRDGKLKCPRKKNCAGNSVTLLRCRVVVLCGIYTTINFTSEFRNVSLTVVGALSADGWVWSGRGRHTLSQPVASRRLNAGWLRAKFHYAS